jgi:hypothetical protein
MKKITMRTIFRFEPESDWDMDEVTDSTQPFFSELLGNDKSVGRLIGNMAGMTNAYKVEEYLLYSELPPIFHEKYVLGTR